VKRVVRKQGNQRRNREEPSQIPKANLPSNPIVTWMHIEIRINRAVDTLAEGSPREPKPADSPAKLGASAKALKSTTRDSNFNKVMSF
jgi:hypothetical protein